MAYIGVVNRDFLNRRTTMAITPNVLIQADTLSVLERMPSVCADLIYVDPPWPKALPVQTVLSVEEYSIYIFRVIQQAQRILKETGSIFFYSDPDLNTDFHLLLQDVFGKRNFESEFIVPKRIGTVSGVGRRHHTLLLYKKSDKSYLNGKVRRLSVKEIRTYYPFIDEGGRYRTEDLFTSLTYATRIYTWKGVTPPPGRAWRYSKEVMDDFDSQRMIAAPATPNGYFRFKRYLTPENELVAVDSIWNDITCWQSFEDMRPGQSVELFERILNIASIPGSLVMDLFCGPGSMPVAALRNDRQFVACDLDQQAIAMTQKRVHEIDNSILLLTGSEVSKQPIVWNNYKPYLFSDESSLLDMIIKGESAALEFKESAKWNSYTGVVDENTTATVLRAVAAFLNSPHGGTILIGVKDDGTITGLEKDFEHANKRNKTQDGFSLFLSSKIRTAFGTPVIRKYSIRFYNINSKDICRLDIMPGNEPFFLDGKFITRNNNQSQELSTEDFYHLFKPAITRERNQ